MHQTPEEMLDDLWQRLARGVADRRAAGRVVTLASVDPVHGVSARQVILRGARRSLSELEVHSDLRADKIGQIGADPRVCVLFWDARAQLQARLQGQAQVLTGAQVDDRWLRIPDMGRRVYGGTPAPGTVIPDPAAHAPTPTRDAFGVVVIRLTAIDLLHLGQDRHRRARFASAPDWTGQWVAP